MAAPGQYVEEFVEAWRELDAVYRDLGAAAWWPVEMREWERKQHEHERARRGTPSTRAGFEDSARRWRREAAELRGELERLRRSTPEQQARWLDPWSKAHGSSRRQRGRDERDETDECDETDERAASPMWPGWREPLWLDALQADVHLPQPLTPTELAEAEEQLGVRLPQEYRSFLLEVAAGIPGGIPAPDIAPLLRDAAGRWSWDGIGTRTTLSRLAEPFPGQEVDAPPDDEPRRMDFASDEAHLAELTKWENEEPPYDSDPVGELTRGALCLHSLGCGDAIWLIVSGPLAGRMWVDHFVSEGGLYALRTGRRAPVFFRDWFLGAHGR